MRNKECCEESGDGEGKANYTAISMGDRSSTVVKGGATNRKVAGSIPDGVIGIFH